MLAQVGSILIGLSLATVVYGAGAVYWSTRSGDRRWWESGRNAVIATAALLGFALLVLLLAFLDDQFYIQYVMQHSSRDLPLYLKISAVWGGQNGSLLLWAFLQALFAAWVAGRPSEEARPLAPWATVFLSLVTAFFVGVTWLLSNPFAVSGSVPVDGQGLNPLLRHPGMVFHPPALYLGYVGLAVPFAMALAALVTGRVDAWPRAARRWTLAAWLFLGLGLLLGMRWAYDVLGWGGYWGWDPVENAGLMPWLTATALLHGLVMQDQRGTFRWWNVILALLSFVLVLFGTFTTRSGLIQSVHAFARSNLGPVFLAAMGVTLVGSLALFYGRRSLLSAGNRGGPAELMSRDGMFTLTLVLFLTITGSVFVGSVLPTLTEAFTSQRFEAGPDWFDRVTGPQLGALVLVMGICPLLGRAVSALRRLRERGLPTILGTVVVILGATVGGFTRPLSLIGFAVIGAAGGTALGELWREAAARSRREESWLEALWGLFGRNRRRYGGYLVHTGVILLALGVIGTRFYPFETQAVLAAGESRDVGEYTVVFEDLTRETLPDRMATTAVVSVYRGGRQVASLGPRLDEYTSFRQTVAAPAVRTGLKEDLYLVLAGWSDGGAQVTLKIFINPLASFLWLGGLVFMMGGTVAAWPSGRASRVAARAARSRRIWSTVGLVVGLVLLALAVWAMWGPSQGSGALAGRWAEVEAGLGGDRGSRPAVGDPAPDFRLELLDGSALHLSDLRGQVVLVNFWSPECQPCEDELPDLQTVWEEYQGKSVTLVGVSFPDLETGVREMVTEFDLTYPNGLNGALAVEYGITGVPETFIVGPEGRVAYVHIGPVTADRLRDELDTLVVE